jgi:hypothetical protein
MPQGDQTIVPVQFFYGLALLACSSIDEGGEMLGKSLLELAALAGRTVVDAAAADEWETAQRRFAQLLGRGDAKQTRLAEQRLEETREKLIGAAGTDVGLIRAALAGVSDDLAPR